MNITEKLAAVKAAFIKKKLSRPRPWWKRSIGNFKKALHSRDPKYDRHHASAARGTAAKNTQSNPWNIRPRKSIRQDSRFAKLRAFKIRYGIQ